MAGFKKINKRSFRFTRIQKTLIGICAFFLTFGIITRLMQGNVVSQYGYSAFSMFRYSVLEKPVDTIIDFSNDFSQLWSVKNENDELRTKLASQKMYKEQRDDALREVTEAEALMKLTSTVGSKNVYASVLNRDVQGWSNVITIDKGSNDGIKVDRAVMGSEGLVGKVVEVSKTTARVKLLTAESEDISVSIQAVIDKNKSTEGSLEKYNKEKGMYEVRIYDSNVKIEKGMKITSSGAGGVFPSGIIIGEVHEVTDLYNASGKSVLVKPSVNFNSITYLSVLVDE